MDSRIQVHHRKEEARSVIKQYIMKIFYPKPVVLRDSSLQEVTELLFPEPEEKEMDGLTMVIDKSVDANLHAALLDLEDNTNDAVVRDTIRKCVLQLEKARAVLEAHNHQINKKARYLMVDAP